jgi:hypothetical protein
MDAINRPAPQVLNWVFSESEFSRLKWEIMQIDPSHQNQPAFGRFAISDQDLPILREYAEKSVPLARETFGSSTLLPTYTLFCRYEGAGAKLWKHKDNNACTYTIDMCVYYDTNWGLFVEDVEYFTEPNQAVAYYGNDQEHWRGPFPDPEKNFVGVVFFHYAEPDHWYFTKGPDYLKVVTGEWSEAQWEKAQPPK